MNVLSDIREKLAAQLAETTGLEAYAWEPERFTAPCVIVGPDTTYLKAGEAFRTWKVSLNVRIVTAPAITEDYLTELEDSVAAILGNDGLEVEWVGKPYALTTHERAYPAIDLKITTTIRKGKEQ